MNPIDANRYTKTNIQTHTPGRNDHVKANKGGSDTNQGNGDNRRHARGRNQKNRGDNKQYIKQQNSNFTGADESLKIFLSQTEIMENFQFINFKESIITHVKANFNHPADIVELINMV